MDTNIEIERKFLVSKPDIRKLSKKYNVTKAKIMQTYLTSEEQGVERRVRRVKIDGKIAYTFTRKETIKGTDVSRREYEVQIDKQYYNELMLEKDKLLNTISKIRYTFNYMNNTIELDVYDFWRKIAIVEVEISNENEEIKLPEEIKILSEVTSDKRYKNHNLAKTLGKIDKIVGD